MTPFRLLRALALLGLALVAFDALAPEAQAGIGSFFSGMSARGRIVQLCVVIAGLSLLIIMKKFSPDSRAFAPNMNYALSQSRGDSLRSGDKEPSGQADTPCHRVTVSPCHPVTEEQP